MRLLTDELIARFQELGFQQNAPIAVCRIIHVPSGEAFYVLEYHSDGDEFLVYCEYVSEDDVLRGEITLLGASGVDQRVEPETETYRYERDPSFKEQPLSNVI